jgi:hypothetical protein
MSEKVILTVQFFNEKTDKYSGKFYDYLIDKSLYFMHRADFIKYPFRFVTTSGYNYRNAKVQAVESHYIDNDESLYGEFKEIDSLSFDLKPLKRTIFDSDFVDETTYDATRALHDFAKQNYSATSFFGSDSISVNSHSNSITTTTSLNQYLDYNEVSSISTASTSSVSNVLVTSVDSRITTLEDKINKIEKEKENKNMSKFGINFKFGAVPKHEVRMSMYGPAFKSSDGWYAYDGSDYRDVTDFLFGEENYCYMFPATDANIELGDYIYHNNGWCRIIDLDDSNRLIVEKIFSHEVVTVLPTKNIFGYEFYTKLMPLFGNMFTVSKEQPFGNMLPLMLMDQKTDSKGLLMMMMAMQGNMDMSNPFMMMALMDEKSDKSNIFETMMLMQMMQPKPHKCEGKCKCHEENEEEN